VWPPRAPDGAGRGRSRHKPHTGRASWRAGLHPVTLQNQPATAYVTAMDNIVDSVGRFGLTDRAAARIAEIVAHAQGGGEKGADALRVAVLAGGCSGLQYKFELDNTVQPDDVVIERGPARVLVDTTSLDLLAGAELDYTDELMGSHFAVRNPNATSACGCGTSFSID
jgi:iron-sulfur cluster insertion protein